MEGTRSYLLFALMCLIWGTTWIAIRAGVETVPPLLFAGTRLVAAGTLLLLWQRLRGVPLGVARRHWPRLAVVALFTMVATYGLLFWGMRHVPSGLAAIINLSLVAVGLYGFGLAYGQERLALRPSAAVALGLAGLASLFGPAALADDAPVAFWGMAAVVGGSLFYAWGSVVSRPLLRSHPPLRVATWTIFTGGLALLVLSLVLEPLDADVAAAFLAPRALVGWLFLVLFGSLLAFTIYMRLLRDWGPEGAGMYAFVSPVIAVALGALVYGERLSASDVAGGLLMLAGAWLVLRRPPGRAASPAPPRAAPASGGTLR